MENIKNNPFLKVRKNKYDAIPFDKIKTEDFMPSIEYGLEKAQQNIEKIKQVIDEPTFENCILPFETSSEFLDEVTSTYFNLYSSESDAEFKKLAQKISPMLAEYKSKILMDEILFGKVKKVYDNRKSLNLNDEQIKLVEETYKSFVRNGALLEPDKKKKLEELDKELSKLGPQFSQNVLNATNAFELHIADEKKLSGLPDIAKEAAAYTAKQKGKDSGWVFTLQYPSVMPVLNYADDRELRKKITKKYNSRAFGDKFDNQDILKKIAILRQERAELLGYKTHAEYTLQERMAEKVETVEDFFERIFSVAMPAAKKEISEVKAHAKELDSLNNIYGWDAQYYSEKLKKKKFDFDEEELRPYFKMENVIEGIFTVANKLYGLKFNQINDVPAYHSDVKVYEVTDDSDTFVGLLYLDLFPRETKQGGAWMTTFRSQGYYKGKVRRPHVSIVANLTPSTDKTPSLLRLGEVTTIFHEFGHSLHSLLSDCTYCSLSGTNVYWDFVELPSQIMENWVKEKEALDLFAFHYETGKKMPDELIQKVKKAETFNKGMMNIRQLSFGLLDMAWHSHDPRTVEDVEAFEDRAIEKIRLLPKTKGTNTSCGFVHIFHGGYSSGYYSYKWAEVLEADAFELFKEKGIFNKEIANSFWKNILARGNTVHPMELYIKFRGQKPDPDAMLKRDGLL